MSDIYTEQKSSFEDDASDQQLLPGTNDGFPFRLSKQPSRPSSKLKVLYICGAFLLSVSIFSILVLEVISLKIKVTNTRDISTHVPPENVLDCGSTIEEAQARGCIFDVMDYSWTPAPCYNATLSKVYWDILLDRGLTFWSDSEMKTPLPSEEVRQGKHEYVFTTWLLHMLHCEYYIHRQTQVLQHGLPLNNLMRDPYYSLRCIQTIRDPGDSHQRLFAGHHYEKCASGLGDLGKGAKRLPPAEYLEFIQ